MIINRASKLKSFLRAGILFSLVLCASPDARAVRQPDQPMTDLALDEAPARPASAVSPDTGDILIEDQKVGPKKSVAKLKSLAGSPRTKPSLEQSADSYLAGPLSSLGLTASEDLRLDDIATVPGSNGLSDMAYIRYVQTWKGMDVEGGGVTLAVKLFPNESKVMSADFNLFPEVRRLAGASMETAQAEQKIRNRLGAGRRNAQLQSKGKKIMFLKGRWRVVQKFAVDDGLVGAVDEQGETIVWDGRYNAAGNFKGRGIRFGPAATGNNLESLNLTDLKIQGSQTAVFTDAEGNFTLNPDVVLPYNAALAGRWSTVTNANGTGNISAAIPANPPDPVNVLFNPTSNTEALTAQVNGYVHTTAVHNWVVSRGIDVPAVNVSLPTIVNDTSLGTCNAYYYNFPSRIRFLPGASTCRNTAYDTIIYHEYGHFVDDMIGGITEGGLSEGWGDLLAVYLSQQPLIGEDFFLSGGIIRTADNNYVYHGRDEVHAMGQAWAGFAWHLRQNLIASQGQAAGVALAESLVIPVLHANSMDIPSAVRQVAIRDDNDGDLSNGTPHFTEIKAAADRHGLGFVLDLIPPTVAFVSPAPDATISGIALISGTAADAGGLSNIKIKVDNGAYQTATGLTSWTYSLNTFALINGAHTLTVLATDKAGFTATQALSVNVMNVPSDDAAVYDSVLKAPACGVNVGACDSRTLLNGRDTMAGGAEPNQPNTVNNSCADGTAGTYHVDESLDRLKIYTLDGTPFAPGKAARVEATVWAFSAFSSDKLDLLYARDAKNPVWTFLATLTPASAGAQVLQADITIPAGTSLHALRGLFRYGGSGSICIPGGYNDHDDLVFEAKPSSDVTPPVIFISSPADGSTVSKTINIAGTAFDNVALSQVDVRMDNGAFSPANGLNPWTFPLNTLTLSNGIHRVTARATDSSGNTSTATLTLNVLNDSIPPYIYSVQAANVRESSAVITWQTNEPSDSQVFYGLTTAYGSSTTINPALGMSHSETLVGLSSTTLYHYRVRSRDAAGNAAFSGDFTFKTGPDFAPPVISSVTAYAIENAATIYWTTDEASDSEVEYGLTSSYGSSTGVDPALQIYHYKTLANLSPGTTYHYRVISRDSYGNLAVSDDFAFATFLSTADKTPPEVAITYPANGQSVSGTITISGTAQDDRAVTRVDVKVGNDIWKLAQGTTQWTFVFDTLTLGVGTFTITARAEDAAFNFRTAISSFVILSDTTPPVISFVTVSTNTGSPNFSALVSWQTNENADTQIEYGTTTAYGNFTPLDPTLYTFHSQYLMNLALGTLYHFRVLSKDAAGNLAVSGDNTFTTPPGTIPPQVAITFPSSGTVVSGQIYVNGTANDDVMVAKVEVFTDTGAVFTALGGGTGFWNLPMGMDTLSFTDGPHTITAVATDNLGLTAQHSITLVSKNYIPPTVAITSPADGSVVSGPINILGTANDDIMIAKIEVLTDTGAVFNVPYPGYFWSLNDAINTVNLTNGPHTITARVTDNYGLTAQHSIALDVQNDVTGPVISNVTTERAWISSAVITWDTNEPSDSQVEYGLTLAYGKLTPLDPSLTLIHTGVPIELSPGTLYHYRVLSRDTAGNLSASGDFTFTTETPPDTTAPQAAITFPSDGAEVSGNITVSGTASDDRALSLVEVSTDSFMYHPAVGLNNWTYAINTLVQPNGSLGIWARAADASGNRQVTSIQVNVNNDRTGPVIPGVASGGIWFSSAGITWQTNEPSDSQVEYGTTLAYGSFTPLDPALRTDHQQDLNGLSENTQYHYRVRSRDAAGNPSVSGDFTFTTLQTPDTGAPDVSITSPVNGATVSGSLTISGTASDDRALSLVEISTDSVMYHPASGLTSWTYALNTGALSNGNHMVTARATDSSGNARTTAISINVRNNLIVNPGFESGTSNWFFPAEGSVDTVVFHSGTRSARLVRSSNGTSTIQNSPRIAGITGNAAYSAEIWMKRVSVTGNLDSDGVRILLDWYSSAGSLLRTDVIAADLYGTADWTKFSRSFTSPSSAVTARYRLQLRKARGTVYFDDTLLYPRGTGVSAASSFSDAAAFELSGLNEPDGDEFQAPEIDGTFALRDAYTYPSPAKEDPTIHLEIGLAESVRLRIYNEVGEKIEEAVLTEARVMNGRYAYEHKPSGLASGVYIFAAEAIKDGQKIRIHGKFAVTK